jgi:hypothetical protein
MLVTVPSGCIMVTSTFMFSPVATSFIRDRKDYLIDYDWPESYKSIIGELDTYALARIQNDTGRQIPMDKFTLNTAISALRNVKNEKITTQQIYDYGGISGMAIGILVAGACIVFACYTCFTRTPSERPLRRSHPPTYEPPTVRYIPGPPTRNNTLITITSPPRRNTAVRTTNNTMVSDGGLLEDIRRNGRVREQQRTLQQAGRDAEEQEHTPGQLQERRHKNHTKRKNTFFNFQLRPHFNIFWEDNFQLDRNFQQQQTNGQLHGKGQMQDIE